MADLEKRGYRNLAEMIKLITQDEIRKKRN